MKRKFISKFIWLALMGIVFAPSTRATNYMVATVTDLQNRMNNAVPGDTVIVQDGTYNWGAINFTNNNGSSSSAWIVLKAQTFNNVIFSGSTSLSFAGTHILVTGFKFANGNVGVNTVLQFRNQSNVAANYCRVSNVTIDNYNSDSTGGISGGSPNIDNKWVSLYGYQQFGEKNGCHCGKNWSIFHKTGK